MDAPKEPPAKKEKSSFLDLVDCLEKTKRKERC